MIIGIDESGSFVSASQKNSWCSVCAYVFPERDQTKVHAALNNLKKRSGYHLGNEIKLKNISENNYYHFLFELSQLNGILFSVATDSHINTEHQITKHKLGQAKNIRLNIPKMNFDKGKKALEVLAHDIDSLSPQLYVQLQCQVFLISNIFNRAFLYYAQKDPKALRRFKWRIDQKNTTKTTFESSFERVVSPILQSKSINEPIIFLEEADYAHMKPFFYAPDDEPKYIQEATGIKMEGAINIGKIIRDDIRFPDSKATPSIQVADLLASGVRRCLRSEFDDNDIASRLLGSLMINNIAGEEPISLICLSEGKEALDHPVTKSVTIMKANAKPLLHMR